MLIVCHNHIVQLKRVKLTIKKMDMKIDLLATNCFLTTIKLIHLMVIIL